MAHLTGQNFWEEDSGSTVIIEDPTKPFFVRLACQPNTGYAWVFASTQTRPLNGSTSVSSSSSVTVVNNEHVETGEFTIRRRYFGRAKFTGESENGAVLGGGGGYVFSIGPHLEDMMQNRHRMDGKSITLTFHYARPWMQSSHERNFTITVQPAS